MERRDVRLSGDDWLPHEVASGSILRFEVRNNGDATLEVVKNDRHDAGLAIHPAQKQRYVVRVEISEGLPPWPL